MAHGIRISDFSLRYTASAPAVLESFSINVSPGTCCAVIGPTGAGKTSLLHCLAGTMRRHHPESVSTGSMAIGSVRYEGAPGELLFPTTGLVLQDPYVQISGVRDTVLAEIRFTLENLQNVPPHADQQIRALLAQLGIEHLANRKPTSLSGGETQRVALATMLIAHPPVLLLDEPTTALDYNAQDKLRRIIRSLKGGVTVIVTDTHLDFGLAVADDIAIVDHGRNIIHGPPAIILSRLGELTTLIPHRGWDLIHALSTSPESTVRHRAQIVKALDLR